MRRQVKVDVREGVAVISLAPVPEAGPRGADPGFDARLRAELARTLATVSADRKVGAVLLRAGAAGWPEAGDPEAESAEAAEPPTLAEIAATLEAMEKPVVISLAGQLGGATMALAIASGWRIAAPDAVIAPAEPAEGRLSPAGMLVRAARRAGARAALLLAEPGRVIGANEAASLGLCDGVVEHGDVDAAALSVARGLAQNAAGSGPPRRRDGAGLGEPAAFMAAIAAAREGLAQYPAVLRPATASAIDVVEAALLLDAPAALGFAEVARDDQEANPASRALRHLVAAERRARLRALQGARTGAGVKIAGSVGFWEVGAKLATPL
uniref:enoyl-CoA hydratase-related protein n=1 Tax=Phaeovulum sp. TaxID=2934796 RepID=UPI00356A86EF